MFNNNGYTPVSANEVEVNVVKCGGEIVVLGVRENVISEEQLIKPG